MEGRSSQWREINTGMCGNWWRGISHRTVVWDSSREPCTQRFVDLAELSPVCTSWEDLVW